MTQMVMQREAAGLLQRVQQSMREHGDAENADKVEELIDKLQDGHCSLAFCGHFSAGKSSLINALCGAKLLPSGPVPTSANLVSIENGEPLATVYLKTPSGGGEAAKDIAFEDVWSYGINGEEVERIRIRYPVKRLSRLQLLDTPGVDSTDERHKAATEAALHLADAVFYVTDYNHVLSEFNFDFMKKLQDWGKPLYLLVNQVDKHDERELEFAAYRRNVQDTLAAWGIAPAGMLFISVKHPGHRLSEWDRLLWLIERWGERAEEWLGRSVFKSAAMLARAHVEKRYPAAKQAGHSAQAEDGEAERGEGKAGLVEAERLREAKAAELEAIRRMPQQEREAFKAEAAKLIDSAILMPAPLREVAERYLQSRKPGFKVGLFFTAARTEQEIAARLETLAGQFRERVEQQLIWFLNEMLLNWARKHGMTEEAIASEIAPIAADLAPERIAAMVNTAAGFTREYTMTYTSLLADTVKAEARKQALERFEKIEAHLRRRAEAAAAELERELETLRQSAERLRAEQARAQEKAAYADRLLAMLQLPGRDEPFPDPADAPQRGTGIGAAGEAAAPAETAEPRDGSGREGDAVARIVAAEATAAAAESAPSTAQWQGDAERMAGRMEAAAEALAGIASGEPLRRSLLEKARQLRQSRFTVALFGAFSAGKSSLANALIGEPVLPVSPNPTTAAINTIMPPEADWPHQTARVRMKTEQAILEDIRFSLSMLGVDSAGPATVEEALEVIRGLDGSKIPARGQTHYSFLRAALRGWPEVKDKAGSEWRADAASYREFVANEEKSCFVERIDLYYQSALAERGVVLVDTPGADSIHARHTGVAFNYIKNADAILFVTYYNHAFSQADKQFLAQLGRVKDSFALDKMFFIVNAADLADSAEELQGVLRYVEGELNRQGIRSARLFPVSSRMALQGKIAGDGEAVTRSGMSAFEREFAAFAAGELLQTALRAGEAEIGRAADELQRLIALSRQDERELREQAAAMREAAGQLADMLDESVQALRTEALRQEIRELMHYAEQRCMYRFGEWYNDAFHPSALRDDTGNTAAALNAAWRHLLQSAAVEISQETLATSLRIERFIAKQTGRLAEGWQQAAAERMPGFALPSLPEAKFATPQVGETLGHLEPQEKTLRRWFKNAKSFFEGGGKEGLRAELEKTVAAALRRYVEEHEALLVRHYEPLYADHVRAAAEAFQSQMRLYVAGYEDGAASHDIADLESRLARISRSAASFA